MRRLETRLVDDVRAIRQRDPRGALLLVVPSRLLGARLRRGLARALGGVAGLDVVTLPELADRVAALPLAFAGRQPLPAVADRLLVDRALRAAVPAAGGYFSGVLDARNFPAAVLRTLLDLKRAGLRPEDLEAAFPASAKVRELAACQRGLDAALHGHGYYDASDLLAEAARLVTAEPERLGAAAVLVFGFVELNPLETRLLEACGPASTVLRYAADADQADLPAPGAIEIVAAPGEEREVREIARVILAHAEAGGRFDEVGILLRQPAAYLPPCATFSARRGSRTRWGRRPAVAETPGRAEPAPPGGSSPIGFRARRRDGVPRFRRPARAAGHEPGRVGAAVAPGRDRRRRPRLARAVGSAGPPVRAGRREAEDDEERRVRRRGRP